MICVASGAKSTTPWSILLRAAGSDAVLARYRAELGTAVSREIEGQSEQELWRAVSDFLTLWLQSGIRVRC